VSILTWSSLNIISPLISKYIFLTVGSETKYLDILKIHTLRLPAKYIPGGIWHAIAKMHGYHELGISKKTLGLNFIYENLLAIQSALTCGGILVYLTTNDNFWKITALSLASVSLIVTPILIMFSKRLSNKFSLRNYIYSLFLYIPFWLVTGFSFALFFQSLFVEQINISIIELSGTYIFSWAIGYLAIFSPQGIGITEIIANELINPSISSLLFITYLFTFRIVILISDIITWLISIITFHEMRRN
jgi:hypothetical protein